MTSSFIDQINEQLINIARQAGFLIKQERERNELEMSFKPGHELVTSSDLKADQLITSEIHRLHPDHQILSEESSATVKEAFYQGDLWIIDPIDGTVNYAHGHSQVGVSIAYAQDGIVQCAVVYNPFTDELFNAIKGKGATLNQLPIKTSETKELRNALIATGFPYTRDDLPQLIQQLSTILSHCQDIRRLGSAALDICWVAAGRLDGYYETVKPWDCAAACLIAREAGAVTGHYKPVPEDIPVDLYPESILVASPLLYQSLHQLLSEVAQEKV